MDWLKAASKTFNLWIDAEGPFGSGKYWNIAVGLSGKRETTPTRGVCFMTSALGWLTLQHFKDVALPWADVLDSDGKPELIV